MNNKRLASILALSFLFLTSYLLFSVKSTAQSRSISPSLEGTKWRGTTTIDTAVGKVTTEFDYDFIDKKSVRVAYTAKIYNFDDEPEYVAGARPGSAAGSGVGTYKQNGNSIFIEFPDDHRIEAKIENDRMVGELTTESGNKRSWSAVKISDKQKAKESYRRLTTAEAVGILERVLNRKYTECLPKTGILKVKLKDGSIRRIDLSQSEEITIEHYTPTSKGGGAVEDARSASRWCLPEEGILRVEMKDGSIRRIDLSQAEAITVER